MKQAIQEAFIRDVLPNYTSYATYFQLVKKITEDPTTIKLSNTLAQGVR